MTVRATPGGLVCVNRECAVAGYPTTRPTCVTCGRQTKEAAASGVSVPPMRAQRAPQTVAVAKGVDVGSRVIFGGFWALVTIAAVIGGFASLANGKAAGFLLLVVGVLAGLYARYIFRGGRFRFLFW